jgi:hypothetical protein
MKKLWLDFAGERPEISDEREMVGFILRSIAIIFFVLSFFALLVERNLVDIIVPQLVSGIATIGWVLAWYPIPKKYED